MISFRTCTRGERVSKQREILTLSEKPSLQFTHYRLLSSNVPLVSFRTFPSPPGLYARSKNRPIQYQEFIKSEQKRQRYWARNFVGWPRFGFHSPNASHDSLASWEQDGRVHWLITQNVDALHFKAGSRRVTELHGSAHRVVCLDCHHVIEREEVGREGGLS